MSNAVLNMFVKLGMDDDEYKKGLSDAEKESGKAGEKIGNALKTGAKVAIAGLTAAAAAVGALTKASIDNYAEFEQLVGGAELMFGEGYDFIMQKSQQAYKTVQMSQNEYLTQVNGFAVGLKESLGGNEQAAAELADRIVTAEADIVSATGNTQEAVQAAFNGIMKGNFTMLDNLQLGITPTKEGMQEVIDKMNELNGTHYEMGNLADMQNAIVDYVEYAGMAGYATAEGAKTIQGSLAAMKGAWSNLLTGFSNPDADLGALIGDMVDSAKTAFGNLLPVAKQALSGITTLIAEIAPVLVEELPSLVQEILPQLQNAAVDLVNGLVSALPSLVKIIVQQLPSLFSSVTKGLLDLVPSLKDSLKEIIPIVVEVLMDVIDALLDNIDLLIDAAIELTMGIAEGLVQAVPIIIERLPEIIAKIVDALIENAPKILKAILDICVMIGEMLGEQAGNLLGSVGEWFGNLVSSVGQGMANMFNAFVEWLSQLPATLAYWAGFAVGSFIQFFIDLPENLRALFSQAMENVKAFAYNLKNKAYEAGKNFFDSLVNNIKSLPSRLMQLGRDLVNAVASLPSKFVEIGKNIVQGIWSGISSGWDWLKNQVSNLANSLFQGAKDALGIHSPSKKFAWIGQMIDEGMASGITSNLQVVTDAATAMYDSISSGEVGFSDLIGGVSQNTPREGIVFNQTINSPEPLTPYEVARQTQNANRELVLALRGV